MGLPKKIALSGEIQTEPLPNFPLEERWYRLGASGIVSGGRAYGDVKYQVAPPRAASTAAMMTSILVVLLFGSREANILLVAPRG